MPEIEQAFSAYIHAALDPLHNLTWQTGSLLLCLALLAGLVATALLRYSWVFSKPAIRGAVIKRVPHTYAEHIRLSPPDYLKFHKLSPMLNIEQVPASKFVDQDSGRYYVITVVEAGKRRPLIYREMRLQIPTRRGRVQQGTVQFDGETLTHIRLNNGYEEDDHPEAEMLGLYNVYIRRVRWFDVRHWLMHPVREIRIVVWVTVITTGLPVLLDVLFG